MGYGGYGFAGYGGYYPSCGCICGSLGAGAVAPVPAPDNGSISSSAPISEDFVSRSRYEDYYARNRSQTASVLVASKTDAPGSRYVDYYARQSARSEENKARLHVEVPADAVLWLNGQRTNSTGTARDFILPQLKPGETYVYHVKARWTVDGKALEESREVKVRANKTTTVQLTSSSIVQR
jgi:uncharacterized protein (TIGR03000 family)